MWEILWRMRGRNIRLSLLGGRLRLIGLIWRFPFKLPTDGRGGRLGTNRRFWPRDAIRSLKPFGRFLGCGMRGALLRRERCDSLWCLKDGGGPAPRFDRLCTPRTEARAALNLPALEGSASASLGRS